jgi:rod shape-determining protein MreB
MKIFDFFRGTIGIDPGSEYLRIIQDDKIVFDERSQLSIGIDNKVRAIGNKVMKNEKIVLRPINYSIDDFAAFELMLRGAVSKIPGYKSLKSYKMFFAVPTGISEVEKRAYKDSGEHAGALEVYMIYQSIAASVGLSLMEKGNYILIDIGANKISINVFADAMIVSEGHIRIGTQRLFDALKRSLLNYSIYISEVEEPQRLIKNIYTKSEIKIGFKSVKTLELRELLEHYFYVIKDVIHETIEKIEHHPQFNKIVANGIYVIGGGAKIEGLYEQLHPDGFLNYQISRTSEYDTIKGLGKIIEEKEKYRTYLFF